MNKGQKRIRVVLVILLVLFVFLMIRSNVMILTAEYDALNVKIEEPFNGFRIMHLSDLHSKELGSGNSRLIKAIDKQMPDIVLMGGDMINVGDKDFDVFLNLAKDLTEKYDVYYTFGQEEQLLDTVRLNQLVTELESYGVIILNNEKATLEREESVINIYGLCIDLNHYESGANDVESPDYLTKEEISQSLGEPDPNQYNILMAHIPAFVESYTQWGADFTLSGHLHGGMIRILGSTGVLSPDGTYFPRHSAGIVKKNEKYMVVSKGIGNGYFPFRAFNPPEIGIITLDTYYPEEEK